MNPQEFFLGFMAGVLLMGIVYVFVEAWRTRSQGYTPGCTYDHWDPAREHYQARVDAYQARAELYDEAERAPFDVDNIKYAMAQRHKLTVGAAEHERFMRETKSYVDQMDGVT